MTEFYPSFASKMVGQFAPALVGQFNRRVQHLTSIMFSIIVFGEVENGKISIK